MLEDYVAFYLQKYLGKYVKGVSKEALKISAWKGNVELTNMQLKPEALLDLKLPIKVKGGFLGSVKLKVPWSRLGQEPVIVELDRIFVLAEPSFKVEGRDEAAVQEARYQSIKEAETMMVNSLHEQSQQPEMNNSWLGSLIGTIISNIKLSVTNIHIRYEDTESNPDQPFAFGVTLEKLAAVTVDENGKEVFVSGGALDKIHKSGELKRLALYFDTYSKPWDRDWENLSPAEWSKVFEPGIRAEGAQNDEQKLHQFLLQPVDGMSRYNKLGTRDERSPDKAAQSATVILENVTLCLSEPQYRDILKLVDNISAFNRRVQYSHLRPSGTIKENPKAWWQYAVKATTEQIRKASGHVSWEQVLHFARQRKKYVSLYAKCLVDNPDRASINDNEEIRQLDRELDKDVIVQWRMLAHTLADQAKAQTAEREKDQTKKSWWWFRWGGNSGGDDGEPRGLTDEDWQQLNQAIGYEEGKPSSMPGQDPPNMLHTVLEIRMHYNASKLLSANEEELLELSCEGLQSGIKLYSEAKEFDLKLESYKICSPEGLLGESANHLDALTAKFSYLPMNENLDWSLSAKASPCYITYYNASIDRVVTFFRSKSAVSREVALQTAVAVQMTLEDVARKTQQQLNESLKNRPRFSLFLDIAAPKITIPTEFYPKHSQQTRLMLDLGHFTMKTERGEEQGISHEESELYMCFRMQLKDVSAFLVDGDCDWNTVHVSNNNAGVLPVIDRCGVLAAVQQICVPHPLYPTTRVAVRLPSLGMHFSPARYHRLMQVVKVFQSSPSEDSVRPWDPADFEGDISVLSWKGFGNREAVWKHCYGALAGPFLYILESPSSQAYEHCVSLIGKQVYLVPTESVGGVEHVLAICDPNQFNKKVVESVNALVLQFKDEETLNNWRAHLVAVIHKIASTQAVVREKTKKSSEEDDHSSSMQEKENLFVTGALDELKICISNTKEGHTKPEQILLEEEISLLELRAVGSKVEFVMREHDMAIGAALLSLEIEDKWYGETSPSCRFLARSIIDTASKVNGQTRGNIKNGTHRENSDAERFFDSADELEPEESLQNDKNGGRRLSRGSSSPFYDADTSFLESKGDHQPPSFGRTPELLPSLEDEKGLDVERYGSLKNFIKAQVILSTPEAPHYADIDKQVKVSLATLAFFFNRPTLVALMGFVNAINAAVVPEPEDKTPQSERKDDATDVVSVIKPADVHHESGSVPVLDRKDSVVKGLLGKGKARVLFLLVLDMDRAQVILNRDDGAQFATLSQDNLHVMVKIFPASYAIMANLGNLRISDDSLTDDHPYFWLCDMRDPAGKSFVELEFVSFNQDDDDYEGYEFSISGKLSEVRVVYLHRFIQEIAAYFMGLLPENIDYIVQLKDKVSDVEKTFTQSEVEGAPALKLDLSLNKPVIILPKNTNSNSFLELDILHIQVVNTFQWLGGGKEDIGAVRLETDTLKVENIHLMVAVNGKTGENIIEDSSGILVVVRRTLRDLRHQLPAVDASVEVKLLKAALSDKEYQTMIECCLSNLSEAPNLPPPVSNRDNDNKDVPAKDKQVSSEEGSAENESRENNEDQVWTTLKLTVDISLIELALFVGRTEDTPLASIQISDVWAAFKMSTNNEQYVMVSLDALSVTDDREGIEPELRFMVGQADNADRRKLQNQGEGSIEASERSILVMLVLDAKISPTSQMITLRLQRPRVLLALDFLLAVAEFFIPSIADMLPNSKSSNELPYDMKNWIFLHKSPYYQESEEVLLSPKHVLVADDEMVDAYVYDGGGGRIRLTDTTGDDLSSLPEGPLIIVGHGKSLRFRNVIIQNADNLDQSIFLGSNSSYSTSEHDGVYLEHNAGKSDGDNKSQKANDSHPKDTEGPSTEITFDLQAIGPELVIYAASGHSSQIRDRLLCVKMDMFSRLVMKGDDLELNGKINGLSIEGRRGLYVLEPIDTNLRYSRVSSKQNVHVNITDVVSNLTFSTIQLILKLQEDAQSFLLLTSKKITVECTEFDKIWADAVRPGSSQIVFWRPRVPPGFAVLGDCLTLMEEPPSKGVLALNMNLAHVKKPVDFSLMWCSSEKSANEDETGSEECSVWLPIAPQGYVALGCVACRGRSPPQPSSVLCVLKLLATQWYMKDCIYVRGPNEQEWGFWRADNSTASFLPVSALRPPMSCKPYELRHVGFELEKSQNHYTMGDDDSGPAPPAEETSLVYTTITRFKLVWWDKGVKSKKSISVWRPVVPPGCALLGDVAVEGYEPPAMGFVPRDPRDGPLLQKPLKFVKMGVIQEKNGLKSVTFWFPVSPPGYVALGCLATRGFTLDNEAADAVRCVRNDLVVEAQFPPSSLWDGRQVKRLNEDISIWTLQIVDNETKASTFVVNITQEAPPKQLAFQLKELGNRSDSDNLVGDAEARRFSATVFDDFGGLMAPLVNLSLNGITTSLHGTSDTMTSTANFSLLATTYNGNCEAWEPLIEQADGYVRYSKSSSALSSSSESQVSLAVTNDLNINISTGNLNLLLEAYASWNKLSAIETSKREGMEGDSANQFSENEPERKLKIICHNNLGQHLFCRMVDEDSSIKVVMVPSGQDETLRIPSMMSLQDPLTRKNVRRKAVKFMSLKISKAEVPKDDGFGGRQYMVAVRVLPQLQTADQHQLQYQSARTRCVNPSEDVGSERVVVDWEELFVFEVERGQTYGMEILVTDLAKGATAGYCFIPSLMETEGSTDDQENALDRGSFEMEWHSLYIGTADQVNHQDPIGRVCLGHRFFSVGSSTEGKDLRNLHHVGLDPGTIQVAPSSEGPWTKLCLNLASKNSYLKIGGDAAMSELTIEGGIKHLAIRSLVKVKNNTGVTIDVSLFPHCSGRQNSLNGSQENMETNSIVEELFENERYQPVAGWGSSWPGHLLPTDPGRWSRRDLTGSSQEFPNIELPLGWEWSSDWYVETVGAVDEDGWAYGFHFKSLSSFPPETSNQKLSFVRRRRWVRTRQRTSSIESTRCILGSLKPGETMPLPIACFRETRQDYFLQLRPQVDQADGGYGWTQVALCHGHGQQKLPTQEVNVRALYNDHVLSSCLLEASGTSGSTRSMWFCMDVDFTDIGKDVYIGPIKDCQMIVNAPLKIVNHLPVSAEYAIFDNSRVRGYRMQDRGMVSSGETAEIYNGDVRKPLYLSFIPEGSWHSEKDVVLISHPFWEVAKYLILKNSSTKRTIKVHIEHDYEEKEATAKVFRISVPYWIDCKRCPPIRLRVMDVDNESKHSCLPDTESPKILEEISYDELQNPFTMISPFSPQRSGLSASLSITGSEIFGPIAPLADLEKPDGTVELIAFDGKSYFRVLVSTTLCPLRFAHTKVISIRPYVTFTNRFGKALFLKQSSSDDPNRLSPSDWRTSFPLSTIDESQKLQIRLESSQWSYPLEIQKEETLHLFLQDDDRKKHFIRVEIRGYQEGSRFVVVFRRGSLRGPYRIENRTTKRKIRFRQLGTPDEDWELLYPHSTRSFTWKNPCEQRILEVLLDELPMDKSLRYELDNCPLYPSELRTSELRVRVVQLQEVRLVKFFDGEHEEQHPAEDKPPSHSGEGINQLKIVLDIGRLGFSVIDQRPQEILFLFMENFKFSVLNSSQENTSRFKLRIGYLQLDDQDILTTLPVIFAPETREIPGEDCVVKSTIIMLNDKNEATQVYPHVGAWFTKRAWCVNVHEPVIWTALAMYSNLQLDSLSGDSEVVEADPEIRINLVDVSEARLKLTLQTEPGQRPRGVLGIWSPIVSLLGNTSKMPIHITGVTFENRYMRQSELTTALLTHLRKDLVHQAFQLLFGVNVLGMASSTLETLSKSAADLSRDGRFQQLRIQQDRLKHVSGVGDGLLRGGEALARGFAFGLSGVVTKPVTNARENGVTGFIQGIGKAFVGFVMQPISGVLDFIALTVDGVNVSYARCFEAMTHDRTLTRIRLPRAIRGDGILTPYDERAALGQALMQLAEAHNFGQNVVFKEPAKFALSDFYEDHFEVAGSRVVMITNRRVMLLLQPNSYKSVRNVVPSNPCRILWEVPFVELLALEVAKGSGSQVPSFVILHLRNDPKTFAQVIKCSIGDSNAGPSQAELVLASIKSRWIKYGPDRKTLLSQMRKWQQTRSLPTPRASKRVLVSDEERSKREFDTSFEDSESSQHEGSGKGSQSAGRAAERFTREVLLFEQIWKSEKESSVCCTTFSSMGSEPNVSCTIWRPIVPEGYVSVGDVAYRGKNPPTVTVAYKNKDGMFAPPVGFDLVWRNWKDGFTEPVTIWKPKAPHGYVALGCVAVAAYLEPEPQSVWCARQDIVEDATFDEHPLWQVNHPWHCYLFQVHNDPLTFITSREQKSSGLAAKRIAVRS